MGRRGRLFCRWRCRFRVIFCSRSSSIPGLWFSRTKHTVSLSLSLSLSRTHTTYSSSPLPTPAYTHQNWTLFAFAAYVHSLAHSLTRLDISHPFAPRLSFSLIISSVPPFLYLLIDPRTQSSSRRRDFLFFPFLVDLFCSVPSFLTVPSKLSTF